LWSALPFWDGCNDSPAANTSAMKRMKQIITMQSNEFAWLSNEALIKWLTTYERRPNLLIVAQGLPVEMVADQLMTLSTRPTLRNLLPGRLHLPAAPNGTVVLQNVTALSRGQQIVLNDWLAEGCGDTQIISIATSPLWPLVQNGEFLEGLFYRISVVRLEATADTFVAGVQPDEARKSPRA